MHLHLHRRLILSPRFDPLLLATTIAASACWTAWGLVLASRLVHPYSLLGAAIVPLSLAFGIALTWRGEIGRLWPAAIALAACIPLVFWFARYPAFALVASGAVVSLAVPGGVIGGRSGVARSQDAGFGGYKTLARVNAALGLGVAAFAGFYVAAAVASLSVMVRVPPILLPTVLGAAFGFVAAFGHLATQARYERDDVELLFRAEKKRGPVPPLAAQALHLYRRVRETLPPAGRHAEWDGVQRTVSRLVLQVLGLARQAREMAEDIALSDVDDLTRREQAMRDAAAGATDVQAKQHYADTAAVLAQRLHRLRQFGQRRERVEALCHHCLSVLENLRLALAQARISGETAGVSDVAGALDRLNALQSELDCTAEALRELEPDFRPAQSPPAGPLAPEATA